MLPSFRASLVVATVVAVVASFVASVGAQRLIKELNGQPGERFGSAAVAIEDLDGDGWREMLVGAPANGTVGSDAGAVYVVSTNPAVTSVLTTILADLPGERFGASLAAIGDVNGDGYTEVAIGSWGYFNGGNYAGRVQLYRWRPGVGGPGAFVRLWQSVGSQPDAYFGWSVAGVGDVNGDRVPDVLAGAPYGTAAFSRAGLVTVLSGLNGATLLTVNGREVDDHFGAAIAGIGDVNNDNVPDWIAGARFGDVPGVGVDAGYARVHSGATGARLAEVAGSRAGDRFGISVAGLGLAYDKDGIPDFAVGARFGGRSNRAPGGAVYAYSGATFSQREVRLGGASADELGFHLASGVDFDVDGTNELIVAVPGSDNAGPNAGSVFIHSPRKADPLAVLNGNGADDRMATYVAAIPAASGSRPAHGPLVALCSPTADETGMNRGRVQLFDPRADPFTNTWRGTQAGDGFGFTAVGLGDADGDGYDDYAYSILQDDTGGLDAGMVVVVSGRTRSTISTFIGRRQYDRIGASLAAPGDVDGDGLADLAIGGLASEPRLVSPAKNATLPLQTITGGLSGPRPVATGDLNQDGRGDLAIWTVSRVYIIDGSTGTATTMLSKSSILHVDSVGDVDRDGTPDLAVCRPESVEIISGRTFGLLKTHQKPFNDTRYWHVAGIGDLDEDGRPEYVMSSYASFESYQGTLWVINGRTHSTMKLIQGGVAYQYLGRDIHGTGDVNGDGIPDFAAAAGAVRRGVEAAGIKLFSGRDFSLLFIADIPTNTRWPSSWLLTGSIASGDFDGDGLPELLLASPTREATIGELKQLDLPVAPLALRANTNTVSATNATATFSLTAPPRFRNHRFVMAGSLSGTSPGTPINASLTLPLVFDPYFVTLIAAPNTIVNPTIGKLDTSGRATAQLSLGLLPKAAVGLTVHHAYAILDPTNTDFAFVSNPWKLTIIR